LFGGALAGGLLISHEKCSARFVAGKHNAFAFTRIRYVQRSVERQRTLGQMKPRHARHKGEPN